MNDLPILIKQFSTTVSEYLKNGKHQLLLKVLLVISSALMIYTAGKSLGEFIYYVIN